MMRLLFILFLGQLFSVSSISQGKSASSPEVKARNHAFKLISKVKNPQDLISIVQKNADKRTSDFFKNKMSKAKKIPMPALNKKGRNSIILTVKNLKATLDFKYSQGRLTLFINNKELPNSKYVGPEKVWDFLLAAVSKKTASNNQGLPWVMNSAYAQSPLQLLALVALGVAAYATSTVANNAMDCNALLDWKKACKEFLNIDVGVMNRAKKENPGFYDRDKRSWMGEVQLMIYNGNKKLSACKGDDVEEHKNATACKNSLLATQNTTFAGLDGQLEDTYPGAWRTFLLRAEEKEARRNNTRRDFLEGVVPGADQ